ncbi:hypothetical protein DIS24_g3209 [Lasiodiplodia hormozganensis]|uniref:Zn(2)-C6 fungal-type domain-containing protein n=1 Tax=Lasiodiplodia hormozganensis TaxID=869390 RepID=A0AA39YYY7_9PEZI|nr:hypothetical protein DIS24_g3209 [Lasiodiplodia hormozganensis]
MASKPQESIIIGPKPTKACVNCRRQKMKCQLEPGSSTETCKAAIIREPVDVRSEQNKRPTSADPGSVLGRLEVIEALLGIRPSSKIAHPSPGSQTDAGPSGILSLEDDEDPEFSGLKPAVAQLRCLARQPQNDTIWAPSVMKQLWTSFHDNVPGLHFLSKKQTFSSPTPLLLASVLYVSALHHPISDIASLAPHYFVLTCSAIADLSVPSPRQNEPFKDENLTDEQRGFQDVLGLILAGLVSEAYIKETGIWISIGYRILLDYCPMNIDERSREWCGLFRGLQIIDLEHASLYMSCPILPRKAPLASLLQLQTSGGDPYDHLTQMMHIGLSHFTGRGIPTIWSFIFSNEADRSSQGATPFTENDLGVIKHWARQLDDWLVRYSGVSRPSAIDNPNLALFRQYILQRLFVLSIYHPARGFNMFARNVATAERQELLLSARAALRLHNDDHGIWSNWDLVMITWAALLVLQGMEDGTGESDDLRLIQSHLLTLKNTSQPPPSLRHQLASRLETDLQRLRTPPTSPSSNPNANNLASAENPEETNPWALFNQDSIRLDSPSWQFAPKQQYFNGPMSVDSQQQMPVDPMSVQGTSSVIPPAGGPNGPTGPEQWPPALMRLFGNGDFDIDPESGEPVNDVL